MLLKGAKILGEDFILRKAEIKIKQGKIAAVGAISPDGCEEYSFDGKLIIPGLVDIHSHGCVGGDYSEGDPESHRRMADYLARNGVTSHLPTTMTLPEETLAAACAEAAEMAENGKGSRCLGIHLEGPYLSYDRRGAHNPQYLRNPDPEEFERLNRAAGGRIRLVSLAPELPGAVEFIAALKGKTTLSIAHTTGDYELGCKAFDAGANHLTHTFNAMTAFSHRQPGVIGAAADCGAFAELISDGIHVHPSMVRAAFRIFGEDRLTLISDSMAATGFRDGKYQMGGQEVTVKGPLATLADGTISGSATNLFDCMKKAVSFGIPFEKAVKAASFNPARSIGLDRTLGSIAVGKEADLVILNEDLSIHRVMIGGAFYELENS